MLNRLARGLKQNLCLLCGKIYANKSYPIGRLNLVRLTNAIDDALFLQNNMKSSSLPHQYPMATIAESQTLC